MIAGFRWSEAGAQGVYGVTPDLSTFGKASATGWRSALAGRRELVERGGLRTSRERVFLLSTTHAPRPTPSPRPSPQWPPMPRRDRGPTARPQRRVGRGVREAAAGMGVSDHVLVLGRASNLVVATLGADRRPSQPFRTLFLRQLIAGGVIGPSFVVSAALTEDDIDRTVEVVGQACAVYRKALDAGDPAPVDGWAVRRTGVPPICVNHDRQPAIAGATREWNPT